MCEDKLILIHKFPLENNNYLGIFFIWVDMNEISSYFKITDHSKDPNIFVYTSEGEPIFSSLLEYPKEYSSELIKQVSLTQTEPFEIKEHSLLIHKSSLSNWIFVQPLNLSISFLLQFENIKSLLPFWGIFLIFAHILVYFISKLIYKPLQEITNIYVDPHIPFSNELDYIKEVVNKTACQDQILKEISPEVTDHLFSQMLLGIAFSTEDFNYNILTRHLSFQENDLFVVIAVHSENIFEESHLNSIYNFLLLVKNSFQKNGMIYFHLNQTKPNTIALSLIFSKQTIFSTIILCIIRLQKEILEFFKNLEKNVYIAHGEIYSSMKKLNFSYQEALIALNYKSQTIKEESSETNIRLNFYAKASALVTLLNQKNELKSVSALLDEILTIIQNNSPSIKKLIKNLESFFEAVVEVYVSTISYKIPAIERLFLNIKETNGFTSTQKNHYYCQKTKKDISRIFENHLNIINSPQYRYIEKTIKYIYDNYNDPQLSLAQIANLVSIGPAYLSRLFKNIIGVNFSTYVNQYRIDRAKEYLLNHELSIKDIALLSGFYSSQNFIRVFKNITNNTPGEYRKKLQQISNE